MKSFVKWEYIIVSKEIRNGFNLHFGISYIDWENGGFNPEIENDTMVDINKNSIMFGFSHYFNIFNQSVFINKNSVKKVVSLPILLLTILHLPPVNVSRPVSIKLIFHGRFMLLK